jgi:hypothetical protein
MPAQTLQAEAMPKIELSEPHLLANTDGFGEEI